MDGGESVLGYEENQGGEVTGEDLLLGRVTLHSLRKDVCAACGITMESFLSPTRKYDAVNARYMFCYMASELGYTDGQIALYVNRDRTTVLHGRNDFAETLGSRTDPLSKRMAWAYKRLMSHYAAIRAEEASRYVERSEVASSVEEAIDEIKKIMSGVFRAIESLERLKQNAVTVEVEGEQGGERIGALL